MGLVSHVPRSKQEPGALVLGLTGSRDSQKLTATVTQAVGLEGIKLPRQGTTRPSRVVSIMKSLALEVIPDLNPSLAIKSSHLTSQNFLTLKMGRGVWVAQ